MSKDWKTPRGLTQGTWDYVRAKCIATDYDRFLKDDRLAAFDHQVLGRLFPQLDSKEAGPLIADFGAGTGRCLLPLMKAGYRGLAIDLSENMLNELQANAESMDVAPLLVQANLVELDGVITGSADHGICMFSTLGMIQGLDNRAEFLSHVRRIVKPGGRLIVHAHNFWHQLKHPGGWRWFLGNAWQAATGRCELGDRTSHYRGINQMFIHSFRRRELMRLLTVSGFEPIDVIPFKTEDGHHEIGWIIVSR